MLSYYFFMCFEFYSFVRNAQTRFKIIQTLCSKLNNILFTMSKALIIVDPQNDFCQGGPLGVEGSQTIFPIINQLREQDCFNHILMTLDWHPENHMSFAKNHNLPPFTVKKIDGQDQVLWPVHCIQESQGAKPSQLLVTKNTDIIVKKGQIQNQEQYSGFGNKKCKTQLQDKLKKLNVKEVVVVGLALDYCVGSTALDAKQAGFQVTVIKEGTKPVANETGQKMLNQFKENGINYESIQNFSK